MMPLEVLIEAIDGAAMLAAYEYAVGWIAYKNSHSTLLFLLFYLASRILSRIRVCAVITIV
jgi:hypothetical protein